MPNIQLNPDNHVALLTMIARCLSGEWLIDLQWLLTHADEIMRDEARAREKKKDDRPKVAALLASQGDDMKGGDAQGAGKNSLLGQINITGPVTKYGSWYSWGSKDYVAMLGAMAKDERVGGVHLVVDSPGGMASGTREFYQAVMNYPKPILVTVDGYAASAAYYYIAGAKKIVATQPTDQIGSIGTYRTYVDIVGYYESLGLKLYDVYAPDATEKNEAYRQIMDSQGKERSLALQDLQVMNDTFLADVRAGRGDRLNEKAGDPMKGRLFFAADAVNNGLIDELIDEGDSLSLLADMIATNNQTSITMSFKSFFQDMKSVFEKHQAEAEKGDGQQADGSATTTDATTTAPDAKELENLRQQLQTLTKERDEAKTEVSTLTKERDTFKQQAETFGEQPGEKPTRVTKTKEDTPKAEGEGAQSWETVAAGLKHNQEADKVLGK